MKLRLSRDNIFFRIRVCRWHMLIDRQFEQSLTRKFVFSIDELIPNEPKNIL